MARTVRKTIKWGRITVPKKFGRGFKTKKVKLGKEKNIVSTRGRVNDEQIIAGLKSDKAKIKGLETVNKGRNLRAALFTAGAEASQALSKINTAAALPATARKDSHNAHLRELISGGISTTTNQRDEDNPEVN